MMKTPTWHSIGGGLLLLFFGMLFGGVGYFAMLRPELRTLHEFQETTCTIIGKELHHSTSGTGSKRKHSYRPIFHIRYPVNGQEYDAHTYDASKISSSSRSSNQAILDQFEIGKTYPCWYDPDNPSNAVLKRGTSWISYIFVTVGGLLGVMGFGMLLSGLWGMVFPPSDGFATPAQPHFVDDDPNSPATNDREWNDGGRGDNS